MTQDWAKRSPPAGRVGCQPKSFHQVWVGLTLTGHPREWASRVQGTQHTETWTPPPLQGWHYPRGSRSGVLSLIPRASHHKVSAMEWILWVQESLFGKLAHPDKTVLAELKAVT